MNIHAPQIIWIAFMGMALGAMAVDHGKPKTGKDNFFISLIAVGIQAVVLYWGGFFG